MSSLISVRVTDFIVLYMLYVKNTHKKSAELAKQWFMFSKRQF